MSQGASDWYLRKPLILAVLGTSLSAGRLSGNLWWMRLTEAARAQPEAVGPIVMQNFGKGSQQSTYGVAMAPEIALFNPTHVLTEGFAINDCAALPTVISQPDHMANMQAIHDTLKAKNPAVDITWQTMNGVSAAGAALRPALQAYYDDEVTKAAAMGDRMLNHYYGLPTPPAPVGGWPKPLPDYLTDSGDGLHPIWDGALEVYFWPGMIYWLRVRMAEYWGLPIPNPPSPPTPPDANFTVAAGGGGGGRAVGAGAGAGGRKRGAANLVNLYGPVLVGFGGAAGINTLSPTSRGNRGFDSALGIGGTGPLQAVGGGGGAGYAISAGVGNGEDGGSGGGSYGPSVPGAGISGQGNAGGLGQNPNGMSGGGGGAAAPGNGGASGLGGVGVLADWPDAPGGLYICGGGPGVSYPNPVQAYPSGGGPLNFGGGGRGGDEAGNAAYTAEGGGPGTVRVWYAGAVRAVGGTVTSFGGQTIHAFTLADMPASMTSDVAPAGNVSSASTVAPSGNFPAWKAFNFTLGYANEFRGWFSNTGVTTGWLQRRWTGAPKRWLGYAVRGWAGPSSGAIYTARDWKIQGSPDGVNWTDLDIRAGQTGWADGEVRAFAMNTAIGTYEYYRMLVSANNGGSQLGIDCLVFLPGLEPL